MGREGEEGERWKEGQGGDLLVAGDSLARRVAERRTGGRRTVRQTPEPEKRAVERVCTWGPCPDCRRSALVRLLRRLRR